MVKIGSEEHWAAAGAEESVQLDAMKYAVVQVGENEQISDQEYASRLLDALEAIGWRLIHV